MQHLVADPNSRVRLIAASFLLSAESNNAKAGAVLVEALGDPALRVRKAANGSCSRHSILEGLRTRRSRRTAEFSN